jgi:hypothetical protein
LAMVTNATLWRGQAISMNATDTNIAVTPTFAILTAHEAVDASITGCIVTLAPPYMRH